LLQKEHFTAVEKIDNTYRTNKICEEGKNAFEYGKIGNSLNSFKEDVLPCVND